MQSMTKKLDEVINTEKVAVLIYFLSTVKGNIKYLKMSRKIYSKIVQRKVGTFLYILTLLIFLFML